MIEEKFMPLFNTPLWQSNHNLDIPKCLLQNLTWKVYFFTAIPAWFCHTQLYLWKL